MFLLFLNLENHTILLAYSIHDKIITRISRNSLSMYTKSMHLGTRLALFCLALLALVQAQDDDICYVAGECTSSPFVEEWDVEREEGGLSACLDLCRADLEENCVSVTYYEEDEYCLGFAACLEVGTDICDDCYIASTGCDGNRYGIKRL